MTDFDEIATIRHAIRFVHRGRVVALEGFSPRRTVLDWLREDMRLTGSKEGCAEGDCGACTAVLGRFKQGRLVYEPVNTCILLLGQLDGCELVTVDDLASDGALHPVQAAMVAHHGSQCGFCTPGIVMSLFALYHEGARPITREAICDALAGNLCRCTGYRPIVDAAFDACAGEAADRFVAARAYTLAMLRELAADTGTVIVRPADADGGFFAVPRTESALAALYAQHPDATLLGGATDVGLWITKALMDLRKIIWLGRIDGFDAVADQGNALRIGAGVTHADAHARLAAIDPDLGEVMRRFGSAQVRASGTVGGNIANGSPIGDLAPCFIALGASVELRRGDDVRTLPLEDFFIAYRRQDRREAEYVSALTVPKLASGQHFRAFKVSKRFDEDISAVMGAFRFTVTGGRIADARIAFGGMAGTPRRALAAEAALGGMPLDDETAWAAGLTALATDYQPLTDQRATSTYRAVVARNLLLKALMEVAGQGEARLLAPRLEAAE